LFPIRAAKRAILPVLWRIPIQGTDNMSILDQIIDSAMARTLQTDAIRKHPLVAWSVMRDEARSGRFVARLVTDAPTPYVLLADTLGGLEAQLPTELARTDRHPADPPEVLAIWFPADGGGVRIRPVPL
jgi:hypothetical protein